MLFVVGHLLLDMEESNQMQIGGLFGGSLQAVFLLTSCQCPCQCIATRTLAGVDYQEKKKIKTGTVPPMKISHMLPVQMIHKIEQQELPAYIAR